MPRKTPLRNKPESLMDFFFFNPHASSRIDTWRHVFECRRLCREIDRNMKRTLTPQHYRAYKAAGEPPRKAGLIAVVRRWLTRLFGGGK